MTCSRPADLEYFNKSLSMLEHYRLRQFLRGTKNARITIVSGNMMAWMANNEPVSYPAIRKSIERKGLKVRVKELRSFCASFRARHNIISEEVDPLRGRISKPVFARCYLKENPIDPRDRTLTALKQPGQTLGF